jgi:hypothetical protein
MTVIVFCHNFVFWLSETRGIQDGYENPFDNKCLRRHFTSAHPAMTRTCPILNQPSGLPMTADFAMAVAGAFQLGAALASW